MYDVKRFIRALLSRFEGLDAASGSDGESEDVVIVEPDTTRSDGVYSCVIPGLVSSRVALMNLALCCTVSLPLTSRNLLKHNGKMNSPATNAKNEA